MGTLLFYVGILDTSTVGFSKEADIWFDGGFLNKVCGAFTWQSCGI
jgi:hypothetical protein